MAHALAVAEAELALHRPDRAASAAELALERAQAAWLTARLRGDDEAARDARRELNQTAVTALRWAKRTDSPKLTVLAALAHEHPRRHRRALRRAVVRVYEPGRDLDLERLLDAVGNDTAARVRIANWIRDDVDELERLGLTFEPGQGAAALDGLRDQVGRAVDEGRPPAEIRTHAVKVFAVDRWHVPAQVVALGMEEIEAGVLSDDPMLASDLYHGGFDDWGRMARLYLRARASSDSRALPLALAWCMFRNELVGDAHGVLGGMLVPASEPRAHALHQQLVALVALRRGDVAAFEHWRISHEVRSSSVDDLVLWFESDRYGPRLREAGRRALRRRARVERPMAYTASLRARLDETVSPADRQRLRDGVREMDPWPQWEAICREQGRDGETCGELWWERDLTPLALAGRTRHFHPYFVSRFTGGDPWDSESLRARASLMGAYAGTVLTASPELQELELRMALIDGEYDRARSMLKTRGDLLYPYVRTWAWLVLDELEAGSLTYDDSLIWLPDFYDEPTPLARPVEPAELRVTAYEQGMLAAHTAQHQEALALLLPVLDALPDEVLGDALAQAALAAHLGGDAETRDALRMRLHAVDPHGSAYALMQARISTDAGRPDEARRFLAQALHWHPDDAVLYQRMVGLLDEAPTVDDAAALAYVAEGAPSSDRELASVRGRIRRGELQSREAVDQVVDGIQGDLEAAWAMGPELLADTPEASGRAIQWGLQQLREAPTLTEAQQWGTATLELVEAVGIEDEWTQRQQIWLAVLVGRAQAGLAVARTFDPVHDVRPKSEGDSLILLLEARQAGEIDDALAWDLWRWAYDADDDATARVRSLIRSPPRGTWLQAFACGELTQEDEDFGPAVEVCGQAWADRPDSIPLAVSQSYLALQQPDPQAREAMATAVFGSDITVPRFPERPGLARGENYGDPWHHNLAVWLSEQEEHQAAADAWWQAYAFGLSGDSGASNGFAQARWRGPLVRALRGSDDTLTPRQLAQHRSLLALVGADPEISAAYAEVAGTRVPEQPGTLTRTDWMLPDRLRHLADWANRDLTAMRIDPDGLVVAIGLVFEPELPGAQALRERYPHASLAQLALVLAYREVEDEPPARPLVEALLQRHPGDPLAVGTALPLLVSAGEEDRARSLYRQSSADHPEDALLVYADAPEAITGPRDGVPAWVRDPASFDERVKRVTATQVRALMPERHASDERAAEVFVPSSWTAVEERPLRFVDERGSRMLVLTSPRASRCQGAECARDLLDGLAGQGRTTQWVRQTTLAGAEATQAVLTNAEEVVVAWVLPIGGRVFTLVAAAPVDRFDALRPALVMLRDGFRPLDAVLAPYSTESLRVAGPALRDDWRLRGRREQGRHTGEGCPVSRTLEALEHDHQRAELLLDLWLSTAVDDQRRALLRCTEPKRATARRLALVALLDEHPEAHAFGRRAVARHPTRVTDDVRTILSGPLTPPVSAPDYLLRTDLPGHGLVEVLGALPPSHAGPLLERLLSGKDPRNRTMAWAAVRLRPELATDALIDQALAAERRMASSAAFLLSDRGEPADAERLRAHLDALPPAADRDAQATLHDAVVALATFLDPADEARLRDLPSKVADGDDPERAERARELLREVARDHARGRALAADASLKPDDDDGRALRWRDQRRRRTLPPRPEAHLRDKSLAEVLPGRDWTFARLAAPGLFASTVTDVAERLTTGDEAVDQRLGDLTSRVLRDGGFASLSGDGGLDPTQPIECAQPADSVGWLCTARVTDRQAALALLGQRASGDDSGVSLPLSVATTAGFVPVALTLLPAILHPLVYPDDDDDDDDDDTDVQDAAERARTQIEVGGMTLQRYSIVEASTRRISIDTERYLFVDDRLWVFSTTSAMERVMRLHEGPALADDTEFRRLTAGWKDGAALQAVSLGRSWPVGEGAGSMEVVLDEGGLHFRYAGAFESEDGVGDIGPAVAQLPPGAVTTVAHGLGVMDDLGDEPLEAEGSDAGRVPPIPVLAQARGVAFGWYLEEGDRLWRRWLAVAPLDDALRKRLRREKTPPGRGKSRRHGGVCYRERAEFLLVGDCTLVDEAAAGPPAPPASEDQLRVAHGTFDGPAAAERLPGLGGLDLENKAIVRVMAPLLGIITDMRVQADWIPAERLAVLEGDVALRLRPPGDRARVIDGWLAATEGKNAATLPRRLRGDEIDGTLRYLVEVPDADAFARDTLTPSQRVKAEVLDPTHVRLTVSPVAPSPTPEPLDADEREENTKRTSVFRIDDPRVVKLARRLAPEGTAPTEAAEKIAAWVHERIDYEVTPRSLDGVEILEAGRGDCTEYSRLTVTLLRAAGVPANVRDGMAASGDELVAHAWVGYHDGERWREIDPTWGRTTASAGHLEMSVLDALALISLGKLTVVEITAGSRP